MAVTDADKRAWHEEMRNCACDYAGQQCMQCKMVTPVYQGVIHHTSYPVGVYERNVEDLIEQGICLWLCRSYEAAHLPETEEETRSSVKNVPVFVITAAKLPMARMGSCSFAGLDYSICRSATARIVQRQRAENAGQIGMFGDIVH
ncbi:MAG: hypothetical protein R2873_27380 [Caldilineaceae bacterium]